jgi:DDE superfamily endonuclease
MTPATQLWSIWQALLQRFAWGFSQRGFLRFAEWITAMAINVEEHTVTQSVLALQLPFDWKAMESFAEHGAWHTDRVTRSLVNLAETAPGRLWHGYRVLALDDTKVHRSGAHVWGTCTFHEYTARCPNRATTVRANNWVVLGALLHEPGKPAWFLPVSGRLYFRKSQLPTRPREPGCVEPFRTKCELAVELFREQARIAKGRHPYHHACLAPGRSQTTRRANPGVDQRRATAERHRARPGQPGGMVDGRWWMTEARWQMADDQSGGNRGGLSPSAISFAIVP